MMLSNCNACAGQFAREYVRAEQLAKARRRLKPKGVARSRSFDLQRDDLSIVTFQTASTTWGESELIIDQASSAVHIGDWAERKESAIKWVESKLRKETLKVQQLDKLIRHHERFVSARRSTGNLVGSSVSESKVHKYEIQREAALRNVDDLQHLIDEIRESGNNPIDYEARVNTILDQASTQEQELTRANSVRGKLALSVAARQEFVAPSRSRSSPAALEQLQHSWQRGSSIKSVSSTSTASTRSMSTTALSTRSISEESEFFAAAALSASITEEPEFVAELCEI